MWILLWITWISLSLLTCCSPGFRKHINWKFFRDVWKAAVWSVLDLITALIWWNCMLDFLKQQSWLNNQLFQWGALSCNPSYAIHIHICFWGFAEPQSWTVAATYTWSSSPASLQLPQPWPGESGSEINRRSVSTSSRFGKSEKIFVNPKARHKVLWVGVLVGSSNLIRG